MTAPALLYVNGHGTYDDRDTDVWGRGLKLCGEACHQH